MTAIDRHTVITSIILLFAVGFGFGFMAGDDFNFDRHSYMGGVSYVVVRDQPDPAITDDPLSSCISYVNAGSNAVDGYASGDDFLAGCRDAYRSRRESVSAMNEPNYVVLRPAPCLDIDQYPAGLLGTWFDIGTLDKDLDPVPPLDDLPFSVGQGVPTGEFEVHEIDGKVAEIYAVHRAIHNCGKV
jgi:hypothetical protein